jgi:uncharacterized protein
MAKIIADTSALIAIFFKSEKHHPTVITYLQNNPTIEIVIIETVFVEFVTWTRSRVSTLASIELGNLIRVEHDYIPMSDLDHLNSWEIFKKYDDKEWSYTDCSILEMANHLKIPNVLGFDRHLHQMLGLGITTVP